MFIQHLQQQTGERTHRPFSAAHINKQIQALKLFSQYVRETGRCGTGFVLERLEAVRGNPTWLTKPEELQSIYEVTGDDYVEHPGQSHVSGVLWLVYGSMKGQTALSYGILSVTDGCACEKMWYKKRYTPIAAKNYKELRYMDYGPCSYYKYKQKHFLSMQQKGILLIKQSLYVRIKQLAKRARIKKKVGTRIYGFEVPATHLQSGMKLEKKDQVFRSWRPGGLYWYDILFFLTK